MKCVIVDDETKAGKALEKLINIHCDSLEVIAVCENLAEARQVLFEKEPEIVFLDLHLPNEFGFDLIKGITNRKFALILTTAHEDYALEAFDHHAQDYLLKPIHSARLIRAVDKARAFLATMRKTDTVSSMANRPPNRIGKIPLAVGNKVEIVEVKQIIRIEALGSYCKIFLLDQKPLLVSKNLKFIENLLERFPFYRVHNSHLINLNHLKQIHRTDGNLAVMCDGSYITVSRRKMSPLLTYIETGEIG